MSKKLKQLIQLNQKINRINVKMFSTSAKSTEEKEETNNKKQFKTGINMAIGAGEQVKESVFKMYSGLTTASCKFVCPTKAQLSQLTGGNWETDMSYIKRDAEGIRQANIVFPIVIEKDIKGEKINLLILYTVALKEVPRYNSDGTKFQAVDKWGEFAWMTEEDFEARKSPLSKSGKKLKFDINTARSAYQGEENLIKLLKPRVNVKSAFDYNDGEWILRNDITNCEFRLDHIKDYFDGRFDEIQEALNQNPDNLIKVYVYVDEYNGQQRHAISREVLDVNSTNYKQLQYDLNSINDRKGTNFTIHELKEYKIDADNFVQNNSNPPSSNSEIRLNDGEQLSWF